MKYSSYLIENVLRLRYQDEPVSAIYGKRGYLLWEPYDTHTLYRQNVEL
jgi:hypothetical protein